ncbi:MAG: RNase adapter RapZ, partial [Gammaproteobacteria bacterium]|nr:RNase adapter RapZ [Gammaproteobacteria bacterium]
MRLIIVSGLSGSGKSVALHTLEDDGFYCIDNLPSTLLPALVDGLNESHISLYDQVAVGIDARNAPPSLSYFPQMLQKLKETENLQVEVLFLQTGTEALVRRFSETRRKHPLSLDGTPLLKAIERERELLDNIQNEADLTIDTTQTNLHQLRQSIQAQLLKNDAEKMSVLFQSFGFKHGVPNNTDFVFDVRCLPNPHWEPTLRPLTGNDAEVQQFLQQHASVEKMYTDIQDFMESWIPVFQDENRAYLTVSIGCTGGRHRSVYLANRLTEYFSAKMDNISLRHREL